LKRIKPVEKKSDKQRILRSSGKQKARRLQNWVCNKISEITGIPWGKNCDIEGREMGQSGCDTKLYGEAKRLFPFSTECKWQESWSIPSWIEQAKKNQEPGTDWILFIKKNRKDEIVIMDATRFFEIYRELIKIKEALPQLADKVRTL